MQIDHLVYAAPDLEAAVASIAERFAVTLAPGGRHVGRGTRNYLTGVGGGAYLEIIGPDEGQPAPPEPRPFGIDRLDEPALVAWAVRCDDIDAAVAQAHRVGLDLGAAQSMERATPSGERLSWRLTPPQAGPVPFLIDWGATRHPTASMNATLRLVELRIETPHPEPLAAALDRLGLTVTVLAGEAERLVATLETGAGMQAELS